MLGDKIKQRRKELGISQEELAQRTGYSSPASIYSIEQNKNDIPRKRIPFFANALNVDEAFFYESDITHSDYNVLNVQDRDEPIHKDSPQADINVIIGNRIKKRRKELHLTQDELAKRMGYYSKTSICRIEKGETGFNQKKLLQFADALNVEYSYFFESTNAKKETIIRLLNEMSNEQLDALITIAQSMVSNERTQGANKMKMPNGTGSIYKLQGNRRKPYVVVKTSYKDGKRKSENLAYFETREMAEIFLSDYNSKLSKSK